MARTSDRSSGEERPNVGEMAGHGGGGDHRGRHQVRARAGTLPAAEVAVGRRSTAFPRRDQIAVAADAHRAAGLAPFEAGVAENAIEPLLLGLTFDQARTGGNEARHLAAAAR